MCKNGALVNRDSATFAGKFGGLGLSAGMAGGSILPFSGQMVRKDDMKGVFGFFLRLFCCFVAAKFILRGVGLDSRGWLMGLAAVFLLNVYLLEYLEIRDRWVLPRKEAARPKTAAAPGPAAGGAAGTPEGPGGGA